jgi:hypothetical protein
VKGIRIILNGILFELHNVKISIQRDLTADHRHLTPKTRNDFDVNISTCVKEVAYSFLVVPLIPRFNDDRAFPCGVECDNVSAVDVREQIIIGAKVASAMIMIMVVVVAFVAAVPVLMIMWHEER